MSILRYRQLKSEIYAKHDDVIFKLLHWQFFKYKVQSPQLPRSHSSSWSYIYLENKSLNSDSQQCNQNQENGHLHLG